MTPMPTQDHFRWANPSTWPWFVYFLLALILLGWTRPLWLRVQRTRALSWPTAQGRVESVYASEEEHSFWSGRPGDSYKAVLVYSYFAECGKQTGRYEQEFATAQEADEQIRDLKGKPVIIAYNPQKPSISTITPPALAAVMGNRAPGEPQLQFANVPAWANPLLWPLIMLSALGLVLSLWVHIGAIAGRKVVAEPMFAILHVGAIALWIPAVLVAKKRVGATQGRDYWKRVLTGTPDWMRYFVYIALGYAVVNFLIFLPQAPPKGYPSGQTPAIVWRGFSGHWMAFYSAALAILFAAANTPERSSLTR